MKQEKRQSIKTSVAPSGIITFSTPAGSFTFDPAGCTDDVERRATLKGYIEKVSNKAAMPMGTAWSVKLAAMKQLADRLASGGAWSERAEGASSLNRACLFAAVAAVRGLAPEQVQAKWQDKPDAVLRTVLTHRDVAAEYARLTSAGSVDEETLFADL
jgi:hypothetical protein